MDLFRQSIARPVNLLAHNGEAKYYGILIPLAEADHYFNHLLTIIDWKSDQVIIRGKQILTKRKVAWYADAPFKYTYSGTTKQASPWVEKLYQLKTIVEKKTGEQFNSCLLNLYRNGEEAMAWHSDGEKDLKKHGAIASLSLGAERKFSFKHKASKKKVSLLLEHGSLLVMRGTTQDYWQHCLPPMKRITKPRINLTFRSIV